MKDAGYALMGVGVATGKDKAKIAAQNAISSPLLGTSIQGAKGLIVNIKASPDIGLDEIQEASTMISEQADENAIIIWGAALDDEMEDAISVIVIATGFPTTDSYAPMGKKDDKKPVSQFQYGSPAVRTEPSRFGAVTRPQDKTAQQPKPQPGYNPFAPQPQPSQSAQQGQMYPNANTTYPNAAAYPNANTSAPAQQTRPVQQPKPDTDGDSDDSYMDIISLFNNK